MLGNQNISGGRILTIGTCELRTHDLKRVKQIFGGVKETIVA